MPDEISQLSEDEYFNIEEINLNEIDFENADIFIIDQNSNNQEIIEIKDEDSEELQNSIQSISQVYDNSDVLIIDEDLNSQEIIDIEIKDEELQSSIQSISQDKSTKIIEDISHIKFNQISVTCTNCEKLFTSKSFEEHICDYDENKMLIEENFQIHYSPDPCIRQLRENNLKIRKFLKDELKVDLKSSSTKSDGPHECNLCERKFVHISGLIRHMEKHSIETIPKVNLDQQEYELNIIVKCLICGRVFPDMKNGLLHIQENHENSKFNENEFSDEEDNNELPERILKGVVTGTVFQCEFCDYLFTDELHLLMHESIHDPLIGYECSFCQISVPTFKEISTHWHTECAFTRYETKRNISMPKLYLCNICELKFNSLEQLYDHRYSLKHFFPRITASGLLKIGCETCGLVFERAELLLKHYQENHLKLIKASQEQLPKSRQYLCDVCGKTYTQSSHLWQHLRFHRGVKPFACKEEGCERRFTIRPDLNDHIRKCHTGERPYHCEICGKRFLTGSVYYQHRLIHRGERRYGCTECDKRFYRADALKNHSLIHSGKKPYPCSYCEKAFRQKGDRDKHVKARHSHGVPNPLNHFASDKKMKNLTGLNGVPFPASMFIIPNLVDIDGNVN